MEKKECTLKILKDKIECLEARLKIWMRICVEREFITDGYRKLVDNLREDLDEERNRRRAGK